MTLVDLVVFDIAGTTLKDDNHVNQCVRDALLSAGADITIEKINPKMGLPKPVAIGELLRESELAGDVEAIHANFVERMKAHYRMAPGVGAIDGVEDAFLLLRNCGVKIALDTGFSHAITEVILQRLGWDQSVVGGVVSSDQVENGRPYPDMIFHHMRNFGIEDATRVAKVGDAPADLKEGTNAGCGFVVGVLCGTHTREQLQPFPHTHLIDAVRDLPELLLSKANGNQHDARVI